MSTASKAPRLCASSAMAAMSTIWSSGLVGVSIQTSLVAGPDDCGETLGAGVVGVARDQSPGLENALEQPERAAVEVGRGGDLVAGPQGREHGRGRRQARGEGQRPLAPFQCRQARFQGGPRRIAAAGVLVALVLARGFLRERRRGVDRHDGRAGGRVGVLAGVDRAGRESVSGLVGGHQAFAPKPTRHESCP